VRRGGGGSGPTRSQRARREAGAWAKLGVDPDQVAQAIIGSWRDGEVTGLQIDDLGYEGGLLAHQAGDDLRPRSAPWAADRAACSRPVQEIVMDKSTSDQ